MDLAVIDPYRVIPIHVTAQFAWGGLAAPTEASWQHFLEGRETLRGLTARVHEIQDAIAAQDPRAAGELHSETDDTIVLLVLRRDQWLFLVELIHGWMEVSRWPECRIPPDELEESVQADLANMAIIRDAVTASDRQAQAIVEEHADSTIEWML
ncbi:hypothetical protein [Parenemella sanctibonifatiensis]|uniref:Uncharacterized protein n=1 Tax=Parenemella sanctibonifatiensis TaxID=2016505 RepID=A0A255EHI6_9ACTN|nr:hypothetical protein [Parenemella sanctibonifatiensis]OYN90987.1 hypothetical protein CGZ91_05790 [Parenemella sanctibonifatiensis]